MTAAHVADAADKLAAQQAESARNLPAVLRVVDSLAECPACKAAGHGVVKVATDPRKGGASWCYRCDWRSGASATTEASR